MFTRLMSIGQVERAVREAERARVLGPFAPLNAANLIDAYAVAGRLDDARAEVARLHRLWPDNAGILMQALSFEALFGNAARARNLFHDPLVVGAMGDEDRPTWQAFIAARTGVMPRDRAFARIIRKASGDAPDSRMTDVLALAALGDVNDALPMASGLPPEP